MRPNRRVGSAINPEDEVEDSGESGSASAFQATRREPSECNQRGRYRWPPGCIRWSHRPVGSLWSVLDAAQQQKCWKPRGRNSDSQCRRPRQHRRPSLAYLRRARARALLVAPAAERGLKRRKKKDQPGFKRPSGSPRVQSNHPVPESVLRPENLLLRWLPKQSSRRSAG